MWEDVNVKMVRLRHVLLIFDSSLSMLAHSHAAAIYHVDLSDRLFPPKCRQKKKTKEMRSSSSRNAGCNLHLSPVASGKRENEKSYKKGLQEKFAHHLHLGSPIPRPAAVPPGGANPGLAKPTLKYRSSPLLVGVSFRSHNGLFNNTSRSVVTMFEPRLVISGVRGDA
jgi:hypothetical protein